jgi:hypothetical protein
MWTTGVLQHEIINIKTNLTEKDCEDVGWIHLAQHKVQWQALVNSVMSFLVPQKEEIY